MNKKEETAGEIQSGLRSILQIPLLFDAFQSMVGSPGMRRYVINHFLTFRDQCKVLDIGCGTGELLKFLPDNIDYTGFDKDEKRIEFAKKKYGSRRNFFSRDINTLNGSGSQDEQYDIILLFCVMHHLDDEETNKVLTHAKLALKPDGVLLTVDGVFLEKQNPLARYILSKDRGRFVRTDDAYRKLVKKHFEKIEVKIEKNLLRIPTDLIIFKLNK